MIDAELMFANVKALSADGLGVTRPSYSATETETLWYIKQRAELSDLTTWFDAAGNLWMARPGTAKMFPYVLIGSHVDSVKQGGNYDGLAGVIAGLHILRRTPGGTHPPLRVVALRGEESAWFGHCYKGSKALFGEIVSAEVRAAMIALGYKGSVPYMAGCGDPEKIGRPIVKAADIRAYFELHIEQGPVLVQENIPLAAVTAIRGNVRYRARCVGEAAHSGATPRSYRKDPVFAVATLLAGAEAWWLQRKLEDATVTCGVVNTDSASAVSRVASDVMFTLECRSDREEVLRAFEDTMHRLRLQIEADRGVKFTVYERIFTPPAQMTAHLTSELVRTLAEVLGPLSTKRVPSGAGHDAAVFAAHGVPTGMLFVRNTGGSHNPAESMDMADFDLGVEVLHRTIKRMSA